MTEERENSWLAKVYGKKIDVNVFILTRRVLLKYFIF
jgi:hypothetical protein